MSFFRSRRLLLILNLFTAAVILALSLLPDPPDLLPKVTYIDKIGHWAAYTVLTGLLVLLIRDRFKSAVAVFGLAVGACLVYGGLIEVFQSTTGRSPELLDLGADLLGALCGAGSALLALRIIGRRSDRKSKYSGAE